MIQVSNLTKRYGQLVAVDGISFVVRPGEIFGFLGPNGAGKTTTLEMIEGLRRPDDGEVLVKGLLVWPNPDSTKNLMGVQLQATSFYEDLTVKETLMLFAALYGRRLSRDKAASLLAVVGLTEKENAATKTLSGGQKQRLAIVTTLVNDPEVIFLDEPSTGLDPQARRRIWEIIKQLKSDGKTVVLTTHYMEEAELLCDRVAVIDEGKIKALDTPLDLIDNLGLETKISFTADDRIDERFFQLAGVKSPKTAPAIGRHIVYSSDPGRAVSSLLEIAKNSDITVKDLRVSSATLEDVFLAFTGKELRD